MNASTPVLELARRFVDATDNAERSAALGDLYNALVRVEEPAGERVAQSANADVREELVDIPDSYLPEGVSGAAFDPAVLRAAAKAHCRALHSHNMEVKAWVVLYLLDAWESTRALPVPVGDETEARPCGGLWPGCSNPNCSWPDQPCIVERSSSFDAEEVRYRALRDRKSTVGDETEALRALIQAVKNFAENAPAEWDGGDLGYEVGGLHAMAADAEKVLARVAGLEAREASLRKALKRFGDHDEGCRRYRHDFKVKFRDTELTCLCGYKAALADSGEAGSKGRPRPDYDPHVDWPERYTDGPI